MLYLRACATFISSAPQLVCRPVDPQLSGACQAVTSEDFTKLVLDSFGKTTLAAATMGSVFDKLLDLAVIADAVWPSPRVCTTGASLKWAGLVLGEAMM